MSAKKKKERKIKKVATPRRRSVSKTKSKKSQAAHHLENLDRINIALGAAQIGVWEYNLNTGEIWWSANAYKIFGASRKTFKGSYASYMKLLRTEERDVVSEEIKQCLKEEKRYFVQHRIIKPDGTVRWIEAVGDVMRNRKGVPVKMMGTVQDITEIKIRDFEKKDWEARYKLLVSSTNQVIYDYDIQTGNIEWSGTIQEVLGYQDYEMGNIKNWEKLIHRDDRKDALHRLEVARQGLKPYDVRYRFKTKSKAYVHIQDKGIFLINDAGQPFRMLGTMQDVSDQIRVEKDLIESNRFKESMENAMPGLLYVYDIKKEANIYINHNITRTLGYGWEDIELLGNNITRQLVHPDDLANLTHWKNEPSRTVKDAEYRLRTKSGEWRWFHSRDTVFQRDQKGNVTQIIGVAQDITERKKMEEALKESEFRFRILQEASFGGIGLHDKGLIIDCNQGLSDITGYSRDELVGSDGLKLIAPEYRDIVLQNISSGYEKTYDVEGVHKNGTRYSLEINGKNIPYKGKKIRVTEFRDITSRKLIEQKILEQNARLQAITVDLQRKNDQLEEFTQIVSHNLRSPMGNILTLLSFMEGSRSEEDRVQFMKYLKESSTNALTTLEELNEVLKLKQNKSIEKQLLEFDKVFSQVKSMISARIAETSAEIKSDFTEVPTIVYPNIYLESIFLNLLTNALKYHKPGEHPSIEVRTYYKNGDIILEIKDKGLGINLDKYGHQIFKLQKTFHKHPESRGIGLFMIKNQIEAMGGEITIESQEKIGTTFYINFNKHHLNDEA